MAVSQALKTRLPAALAHRSAGKEAQQIFDVISGNVAGATFTIGAEAGGTDITVNIQLTDEAGNAVAAQKGVLIGVFDDAAGAAFNTDNYTSILAGTDGAVAELVADQLYFCVSETDGDIDLVLKITGAATSYLGVIVPGGKIVFSGEITHA